MLAEMAISAKFEKALINKIFKNGLSASDLKCDIDKRMLHHYTQ